MAATTAANLVTTARIVDNYLPVFVDEVFSLMGTGVIRKDTNPPWPAAGVNQYTIPGLYHTTAAAQTPAAATDLTIGALASNTMTGVVRRRAESLGIERASAKAGSLDLEMIGMEVAKVLAKQFAYDIEVAMLQKVALGVIAQATSPLYATHCLDKSSEVFSTAYIPDIMALFGERTGVVNSIIMHPTVYWKNRVNEYLTAQANTTGSDYGSLQQIAANYQGNIGNLRVYLNERCYTSGGAYHTYFAGPGAFYLGVEADFNTVYDYDPLLAGGTDYWVSNWSNSVHIVGSTYAGSAVSATGGVTDAALAVATNWGAVTGAAAAETPLAVLISKASND